MSDLSKRLRIIHYFSDDVMAARLIRDDNAIDIMRSERKEAADEIDRLRLQLDKARAAFVRIDAINDNPALFDKEIEDLCRPFLTDGSVAKIVRGPEESNTIPTSERDRQKRLFKAYTGASLPEGGK